MQLFVNGKKRDGLSPGQERDITLGRKQSEVQSFVLAGDVATATFFRILRIVYLSLGGFCIAAFVAVGVFALTDYQELWPVVPVAVVLAVAMPLFMRWMYRRQTRQWLSRLPERVAALPPSGTIVRLDVAGLTSGGRTLAWPDMTVSLLELIATQFENASSYYVDRMVIVAGRETIALDRRLMKNGQMIVDEAYRRLCRKQVAS